MTQIRLNTEQVRDAGRRLLTESTEIEEIGQALQHAVDSLDTWAWDGHSRANAEPLLDQVRPQSVRLADELEQLGRLLQRVADRFENEDSTAARELEGMPWVEWETSGEDGSFAVIGGIFLGAFLWSIIAKFNPVLAPTQRGEQIIGNMYMDKYYQAQTGNTCGFQATQNILRAFGKSPTLEELKASAGYGPDYEKGTNYSDYKEMFEANGINVNTYEKFSSEQQAMDSMLEDLKAGRAVLARIDVGPLDTYWNQEGGHAVWVTGVRVNDQGEITHFICNDSGYHNDSYENGTWNGVSMESGKDGIPDGQGIEYPASEFFDAWEKKHFSYISTEDPIPVVVGTPPQDAKSSTDKYA